MNINIKDNEKLSVLNHSTAHLLAHAVKRLYPHAKFWVGPVIENGFYYDMDLGKDVISEEDLPTIEDKMHEIAQNNIEIKKIVLTKKEALEKFSNDEYKIDLINNLPEDEIISCYGQGDFIDLCRGPHIENTKEIKFFKLLKVSGAYFKGDSKNKMLQRIYGISFYNNKDLKNYLNFLEEVKKRDHRKIGKELELFMISEHGPGFPFFLPNGMIIRNELENYWTNEHIKEGYQLIRTPIMLDKKLWEISGHWINYKDNMYISSIDDREFAIKPMSCPGSLLVYKNKLYSYKDLPLKLAELGHVHRHEASGALSGLFRVRTFTQDDAHVFLRENQIKEEISKIIDLIGRMYSTFGLSYYVELSTRPIDKYIGDIKIWDKAEKILEDVCKEKKINFKINEGDGAFYGPKLDFKILDSINRSWQCGTIQLDMFMPERFDISYIEEDGSKQRPIMLHRVVYGSIERFMGVMIEHYAGSFPLWLSPQQVVINAVNQNIHLDYAKEVYNQLKEQGIRVSLDTREEKLGYRTRDAIVKKIPYQIVIGDQEVESKTVNVNNLRTNEKIQLTLTEFINILKSKISLKE